MDFDKMKSAWKESFKEERISNDEIQARLKMKARTEPVLQKIMRNYLFGLIYLSFMYILLLSGLFIFVKSNVLYLLVFLVSILFILAFSLSYRQLRKIKKASKSDENLKKSLKIIIEVMEKSLQFGMGNLYKYLLIPLALIAGIVIGIFIGAGEKSFMETVYNLETGSIIKIILVIIIGTAITIPVSQIMMKQMYKQHLDELKSCLKEFEETENH